MCNPHGVGSLRWADEGTVSTVEGESPKGRVFSRRRRANVAGGRRFRHEVKVTPEEEGRLLRLAEAQHVTVPRLLVEAALSMSTGETPTQRREVLARLFGIHRLLGAISRNVNQIAKATNATGEIHDELSATMAAVRRTADKISATIDELAMR